MFSESRRVRLGYRVLCPSCHGERSPSAGTLQLHRSIFIIFLVFIIAVFIIVIFFFYFETCLRSPHLHLHFEHLILYLGSRFFVFSLRHRLTRLPHVPQPLLHEIPSERVHPGDRKRNGRPHRRLCLHGKQERAQVRRFALQLERSHSRVRW